MTTHQVFNQSPPLENISLYEIDQPLQRFLSPRHLEWGIDKVVEYGAMIGEKTWIKKGALANQYPPVFHTHNDRGHRIDEVEFHPAWHELLDVSMRYQLHSLPWATQQKGAHLLRMGMYYLHVQNEAGTGCPITMTFSSVPAIQRHLPQAADWIPGILNPHYDPSNRPYFEKKGLSIGMAMTEKQGGTDVRANTTEAKPLQSRGSGEVYELYGHKWFCSAPMCDAFLTLAQTEGGLSCFLFPRWKADGSKNDFRIQRLKNKLGNRSNASSEIEFEGAHAWLMGEEGRGVATILEMVGLTRYDCMIGSSALMRRAVTEVVHHICHRKVMGKYLLDQPLMQNVAADLCLESEAALAMTVRAAECLENAEDESEQLLLRLLMPVGKYWITKRATVMLAEAMECLGGNGYVEESILPRLFREAPVNAIWEGSGNVQCLDVLRAVQKSPQVLEVWMKELESARGFHPLYDRFITRIASNMVADQLQQGNARYLTASLAKAMQAAQLIRSGSEKSAIAFCLSRLGEYPELMFGNLPQEANPRGILDEYVFS